MADLICICSSKQGVLLSTRDPISLQVPDDIEEPRREMALSHKRRLFTRTARKPLRRVKAYLKQTVADPFQGLTHATWELEIIQSLISASKSYKEDPRRTIAAQAQSLNNEVEKIEMGLKKLLGTRVTYFTTQISERLFDPNTKLTWSLTTNNCQNYCDSMLQWDEVGSFLGPQLGGVPAIDGTLYMMSFVTRSGSYLREKVVSKYDVPNGLTEEYLLKFRQGRHNDSDLVDTLQEYWYDWGKKTSPLIHHLEQSIDIVALQERLVAHSTNIRPSFPGIVQRHTTNSQGPATLAPSLNTSGASPSTATES